MSVLFWKSFFEAVLAAARHEQVLIDRASEIVRQEIKNGEIKARCLARRYDPQQKAYIDIHCDLDPRWLDFVAYDNPAENHLRFDPAASARARLQGEDVRPPDHAYEITVEADRCAQLWPDPDVNASPCAPETLVVGPALSPALVAPAESASAPELGSPSRPIEPIPDSERLRPAPTPASVSDDDAGGRSRRRKHYYGGLRRFMTRKTDAYLRDNDDVAIEQQFRQEYEAVVGRLALPHPRYVKKTIAQIRKAIGLSRGGSAH